MKGPWNRLLPLLRSPGKAGAWSLVGDVLTNQETGARHDLSGGVLDLLDDQFRPTLVQRLLDTRLTAALYDWTRDRSLRAAGIQSFDDEVAMIAPRLGLQPGHTVLDLACGHGNFTAAWAPMVEDSGLVVGLDIARAMLNRAATRVNRLNSRNVVLVRGDALDLPFHDATFDAVNCSGGFHQLPDLPRAISQIARVLKPGGRLAASTFAKQRGAAPSATPTKTRLHVVDLAALQSTVEAAGFADYQYKLSRTAWGYLWARRI